MLTKAMAVLHNEKNSSCGATLSLKKAIFKDDVDFLSNPSELRYAFVKFLAKLPKRILELLLFERGELQKFSMSKTMES